MNGKAVPNGWLIGPTNGVGITSSEVTTLVDQGIEGADEVHSQLRVGTVNGLNANAEMVFAVSDLNGNIVGLYRMPNAPVFSIDVAVAKARDVAYADSVNANTIVPGITSVTGSNVTTVALNNRDFQFLALPSYPSGTVGNPPGPCRS